MAINPEKVWKILKVGKHVRVSGNLSVRSKGYLHSRVLIDVDQVVPH
jgi:hypothetical protein